MAVMDRRKQVLTAAAQSFANFGYKATTMDQVAKMANVGKGTIYTFFANKEELFDEILHGVIIEMKNIADREISRDKSFFDNLYRVLDSLLEFRGEHELLIKLSHEFHDFGTPQVLEALDKVENVVLEYIEHELNIALENKEIKPCDPQIVSVVLKKLYITLSTEISKYRAPLSKEEIKQYFRLFLSDGLEEK
ncbi:TetR/AcrR family transcriptional regulator [Paenibacillus crassostreae]|uniref:TetR family transcriptional regulator n=1 Tax=Paenibacillus crassostreae TaxID=1763538 RepID=A0A167AHU6_9BACL|nr:TetR/AcrR family transcriptional regulator [Paenibacillus crassostreae]AOZ92325.1 TetR family transcriptional regulator [Paenibacillus crassostreae]OAB71040.1 TetR family transcriptional regulator [Paenibacillus crassostreae]